MIPKFMQKHLIVFSPYESVMFKEYLCSCVNCLQFYFNECYNKIDDRPETKPSQACYENDGEDDNNDYNESNRKQQNVCYSF